MSLNKINFKANVAFNPAISVVDKTARTVAPSNNLNDSFEPAKSPKLKAGYYLTPSVISRKYAYCPEETYNLEKKTNLKLVENAISEKQKQSKITYNGVELFLENPNEKVMNQCKEAIDKVKGAGLNIEGLKIFSGKSTDEVMNKIAHGEHKIGTPYVIINEKKGDDKVNFFVDNLFGYQVSNNVTELIIHELCHYAAEKNSIENKKDYSTFVNESCKFNKKAINIAAGVSMYAEQNSGEFLAEFMTKVIKGKKVNADACRMYFALGGADFPNLCTMDKNGNPVGKAVIK